MFGHWRKKTSGNSPSETVAELAGAGAALAVSETDGDRVFRAIFDRVALGIWQSTPAGRYVRVNPACAALMGYGSPEAAVDAIGDIAQQVYVDPAERTRFMTLLDAQDRVAGFVARHRRRDGSIYWARLSAVVVRDRSGAPLFFIGSVEDVSELVATQQRLAVAERDHREMWGNLAEGVYRTSPEGRQMRANPALVRLNGYDSEASLLSAVGDIAREWYVDPARRDEFKRLLGEHGRIYDFESEVYRHRTRERIWVSENAWEVRDDDGKLLYYEGTVRDITSRKRAEQRLRESEERFRDYAETASDWYWETDGDHRVSYVSEAAGMLRGGKMAKAIGKHRWDMAADAETEAEKWSAFRALLDRHEPFRDFRYQIRVSSGEIHHLTVSGKPVFAPNGDFRGYRGSSRVITDQIRQREALLASEGRFRDFAATASDWFWETDAAHRFSSYTASTRISPGNPVDGIGKTRWEISLDVDEEPDKWARHREQMDRRLPFRDFVHRIRTADGEEHYVAASGMPVFDDNGMFRGYRGSARIITDTIRQEERLKEAKAFAEAASATKSTFLANMSHELRTPLNAIIGFSEIMDRQMFGRLGVPRYQDYIRDIRDSAQHLLRLIEDILDLSKAEAGKMDLDETDVDLGASIRSACLMLRERALGKGVALQEEVMPDLPSLRGDRRRIRQILLNLVANAVKFTPRGGRVTVSAAAAPGGGLILRVADTGIGIAAEDIARVFEPFVQIGRPKELSGEGTGLGLPLCKELVELHGGTIALTSEPGIGTVVSASFPADRTAAKRVAA